MKRISIIALVALAVACSQGLDRKVEWTVSVDPSGSFYAGEPVNFLFGNPQVDNILFFSGENGHKWENRNRTSVPAEQIRSAVLDCDFLARYGADKGLDIYISNTFEGLDGNDGEADRKLMQSLEAQKDADGNIPGWTKLDYKEGANGSWTHQSFDMADFIDNFCIAIHWHPRASGSSAQRSYGVTGNILIDVEGEGISRINICDLDMLTVMTNNEIADPYVKNSGNGTVNFNNSTADIWFQGVAFGELPYQLDGWAVSTPRALNKVEPDAGTVVKNLQNMMTSYEYTYDEPGNYAATFCGVNANYLYTDMDVQQVKVFVLQK
ncbi:MAG: DUF5017 domain-containing protein [Clostridium sp.]|nr:DUF5017 domain-containing protein [Bacteroides sp.]MCM1199120.1 DUF5017 domain-containing protein [Clostridium sp.]